MCAESKKDILKMAMLYTQEGKWDKVITEYKKLLALDPTDYNNHNMLGDAYMKKGDDANAYQEYMLAAEAFTKQGLADKAAIIYKKVGKLSSDKLSDKDKKQQIIIKQLGLAEKLIESGEIDKAIEAYLEIIKISPENLETYQKLGELHAQKGNKEEALNFYNRIVDIYFKNRLYKKAMPIYQKIQELEPGNIGVKERLAEIFEREGNEAEAKREFLFLADYYWKNKNLEKTDFYAQKAIDFKSIEAHFFKGAALFEKKEYDEAKRELEMLLKFKKNHGEAWVILAKINDAKGNTDEAIKALRELTKADQENPEAYTALAEMQIKKGTSKEASVSYGTAASIAIKKNDFAKAAEVLQKALKLEPESTELLQKLGESQSKAGKKKEAADAYLAISEIYSKGAIEDKAKEYYKMAEEIDPANPKIVERAKSLGITPKDTFKKEEPVTLPKISEPPKPDEPLKIQMQGSMFNQKKEEPKKEEPKKPFEPMKVGQETVIKLPDLDIKGMDLKTAEQKPAAPPPLAPKKEAAPLPGLPDLAFGNLDMPAADAKKPEVKPEAAKPAAPPPATPEFKIERTSTFKPAAKPAEPPKPAGIAAPAAKPPEPQRPFGIEKTAEMPKPAAAVKPPEPAKLPEIKLPDIKLPDIKPADVKMPEAPKAPPPPPPAPKIAAVMGAPVPPPPPVSGGEDDVPSLVAMGDSYIKTGSFDEAIDMYQKALNMSPGNEEIKEKLNKAYSQYAGMPTGGFDFGAADTKRQEEENRKKEEEAKKKKDEEDKKKKDEEAKKKKEEEDKKKKEEEEKKKKDEEAKKKKEEPAAAKAEESIEDDISDDFVTVTTAEIFIKQGLLTEAEKILAKIVAKDADNIEARMRLDELKKLKGDDDKGGGDKKGSKVSYI